MEATSRVALVSSTHLLGEKQLGRWLRTSYFVNFTPSQEAQSEITFAFSTPGFVFARNCLQYWLETLASKSDMSCHPSGAVSLPADPNFFSSQLNDALTRSPSSCLAVPQVAWYETELYRTSCAET